MSEFTFTKGDFIKTDIPWNRPNIPTFGKFLKDELLPGLPATHDAFLYGSFPHIQTWDIDIAVIGKPSNEVAKWIINLYNKSLNEYRQLIDVAMFEDFTLFYGIDEYNKTGDVEALGDGGYDMYKPYFESFKNDEPMYNPNRKIEKISDVLYKHYTSLESVPDKFAKNKRAIYHPMNLKDFNRIYNV